MAVDKTHPDYPVYSAKHKALWDTYIKLEEEEEAKYPDWNGKDHPANTVLRPARRRLSEDVKALQKEYDYLFTEEPRDDKDDDDDQDDPWPDVVLLPPLR